MVVHGFQPGFGGKSMAKAGGAPPIIGLGGLTATTPRRFGPREARMCISLNRERVLSYGRATQGDPMPTSPAIPFAALQRMAATSPDDEPDELLLRRFCAERDKFAFAAIVRRHGGLVLDVCRTVLRNEADAEDAFQATFVALAADARHVRRPAALAGWLHAVAYRTAGKARRARERRRSQIGRAHV